MITPKDHLPGKTIMKISLTFHELTLTEVAESLASVASAQTCGHKESPQETPAEKPKRHRRTKAEMEADRVAEKPAEVEEAKAEKPAEVEEVKVETPRRRRRRDVEPVTASVETPKRRGKATPATDELSDIDVAKAASDGAQERTPKFIIDLLGEFGAGHISQLGQLQRREFIERIDTAKLEKATDKELPF